MSPKPGDGTEGGDMDGRITWMVFPWWHIWHRWHQKTCLIRMALTSNCQRTNCYIKLLLT